MDKTLEFNTLLVPVDFSPASNAAIDRALALASGDQATVLLLHVIDTDLAEFATDHQWGSKDEVLSQMRRHVELEFARYTDRAREGPMIESIVSEGVPFLEILQKADDFAVDAIVIGKIGRRGPPDKLLFGGTAEKVLRGSQHPVIVLPFVD